MKESTKPFFLYLPFQNIHGPYTCDAEFRQVRRTLSLNLRDLGLCANWGPMFIDQNLNRSWWLLLRSFRLNTG